jgi:hypothetical protein
MKRQCITIPDIIEEKLRAIQAKLLLENNSSTSYSSVVHKILEIGLKKYEEEN